MREYIKVHTSKEKIITKSSLSNFYNILPSDNFIRVHKSFIINKSRVHSFTATTIEIDDKKIPIGRSYKINTINVLNSPK